MELGSMRSFERVTALRWSRRLALPALLCWGGFVAPQVFAQQADEPPSQEYLEAEHLYSARHWQQAADAFGQYAQLQPHDERAWTARYYQGEALVGLRKYAAAREPLAAYVTAQPGGKFAKQARYRLAESSYLAGDREQAREDLLKFRREYPSDDLNAYVLLFLGEVELAIGKADVAQQYFAVGLRDFSSGPTTGKLRLGLGNAYLRLGDYASALKHYEAVTRLGGSLAEEGRVQAAAVYYQRGQLEAALGILLPIQNAAVKTTASSKAAYWIAKVQIAQRLPRDAAATAEEALSSHPQGEWTAQLEYVAGEAWRAAGDRPTAMRHFQAVAEEHRANDWADDAGYLHALLAFEVRDFDAAVQAAVDFENAFVRSQFHRPVELLQCRSLLKLERYEEAANASEDLLVALGERPPVVRRISTAETTAAKSSEVAAARFCFAAAKAGLKDYAPALALLNAVDAHLLPADMVHDFIGAKTVALQGVGRHNDAIALLRNHVQHHTPGPELLQCRRALVLALVESQSWQEVVTELTAFRTAQPKEGEVALAALQAAERAYFAGQTAVAVQCYEQVARSDDHAQVIAQANAGLAWAKAATSADKISDALLLQLLEKYPESPLAPQKLLLRGRTLEARNQPQAAVKLYEQLVERYPRAEQAPHALLAAARVCDELQQDRETVKLLSRLTAEYPAYPHRDAVYYLQAWSLIDLDQSDAGNERLQQLVAEFPRSRYWPDSAYHLAEAALEAHQWSRANELLDRLETLDCAAALQTDALLLRGRSAAGEENWGEVAGYMHKVLERKADPAQRMTAEFWTAEAEYRLGQYAAAEKRLAKLADERGDKSDDTAAVIALRRAQALVQLRKWDAAYEIAAVVAHDYNQFSQRHELDYLLGRCLLQQNKPEAARAALEAAVAVQAAAQTETAAIAQWMIGESYFREQNYQSAIQSYLLGYEKYANPRWQSASLLQVGKCYEMLENWAKACETYEVLVADFAQMPHVQEARNRLTVANERSAQAQPEAETIRK